MTTDELIAAIKTRATDAAPHCEGYEDCGDASIQGGDCHGCTATRALKETAP